MYETVYDQSQRRIRFYIAKPSSPRESGTSASDFSLIQSTTSFCISKSNIGSIQELSTLIRSVSEGLCLYINQNLDADEAVSNSQLLAAVGHFNFGLYIASELYIKITQWYRGPAISCALFCCLFRCRV
jgi:hypothetical protein